MDQGLQFRVGAPVFVPVLAGVGGHRRLGRGTGKKGPLVFPGELLDGLLAARDRRPQKGDDEPHRQGRPYREGTFSVGGGREGPGAGGIRPSRRVPFLPFHLLSRVSSSPLRVGA